MRITKKNELLLHLANLTIEGKSNPIDIKSESKKFKLSPRLVEDFKTWKDPLIEGFKVPFPYELKEQDYFFALGKHKCILLTRVDSGSYILSFLKSSKENGFDRFSAILVFKDGFMLFAYNEEINKDVDENQALEISIFVSKVLLYTFCSKDEPIHLKPSQVYKWGKGKDNKIVNGAEDGEEFIFVGASWIKKVIRDERITGVRGHLRLQRYGKNLEYVKVVYIAPYTKTISGTSKSPKERALG